VKTARAFTLAYGAAMVWLACAVGAPSASAQAAPPVAASERSVKAAYLYRFLSYVEWPAAVLPAGAPLVIGLLGAEDVAQELEQIVRNRPGDDRPVALRRLGAGDSWIGVHVLYLGEDGIARAQQVMKALHDRSVLTVSDGDRAVERGIIIGLVQVDSRLRFEVNAEAAERSGLKLSSRLLTVALRVRPGAR
jgi:YfiR/HmsC-like